MQTLFYSQTIKFTDNNTKGYRPCAFEITEEYLAFKKGSLLGNSIGGLIGLAMSASADMKNDIILIPIREITSVEAKKTLLTALVTVHSMNRPVYTFACSSKKEMETINNLLKR
ncbi:MAG: hypothetical protein IJO03_09735 [Clostridia bacterium]|nr:hypothetical protein [Clostridia bacterium]MBQ7122528.1 hypothetical protein [Clostridia bacterium]